MSFHSCVLLLLFVITLPSSPAFFRYRWNLLLTVLRAQMMIGTSTTSLQFHRRFLSLFKSWYFLLFVKTYSYITIIITIIIIISLLLLAIPTT